MFLKKIIKIPFLSNGETFSFTFDKPGLYTYHCTPHYQRMKGSVLVE